MYGDECQLILKDVMVPYVGCSMAQIIELNEFTNNVAIDISMDSNETSDSQVIDSLTPRIKLTTDFCETSNQRKPSTNARPRPCFPSRSNECEIASPPAELQPYGPLKPRKLWRGGNGITAKTAPAKSSLLSSIAENNTKNKGMVKFFYNYNFMKF